MSLKKQALKTKDVSKVTFRLSKKQARDADEVFLVGDFNDWDESATPMRKLKSGDFTATLTLDQGREYQFRYLLDREKWQNDWSADNYVPSPVTLDQNSVVQV